MWDERVDRSVTQQRVLIATLVPVVAKNGQIQLLLLRSRQEETSELRHAPGAKLHASHKGVFLRDSAPRAGLCLSNSSLVETLNHLALGVVSASDSIGGRMWLTSR